MKHSEVRANLLVYVDGELPKATTLQMDAHLRDCAECRQALDSTCSLWTSDVSLSSSSRSTFRWARFESRIEQYGRHTPRETFRLSLPVALRIATVSVLVFCAILFGTYLGDTGGVQQADATTVITQLHLDRFQLPESDPFINSVVRLSGEFEKWGGQ
jgi:anti-sigma factor RsiW